MIRLKRLIEPRLAATLSLAMLLGPSFSGLTAPPATPQGAITVREFRPTTDQMASLTNLASFPNNPSVVDYSPRFEWPTGADDAIQPPGDSGKNNYGVQIIGYFYPPETADYIFAIASDDNGLLFLSTDADPAKKQLIAREPQWNGVRNFSGVDRRTLVDAGTADERYENVSKKIRLTNNVPVYIEALMSEGNGGDSLAVTYTTDGTAPIAGALPILGMYLSSIDLATGPLSLSAVPQSQTNAAGKSATFSVRVSGGTPPFTYQWTSNSVAIDGATGLDYTIPILDPSFNGALYAVTVSNAESSTNTPAARLTVTSDTNAPSMLRITTDYTFTTVMVHYSEPMSESAALFSNYQLSGGITVTAAEFVTNNPALAEDLTNRMSVVLTTAKMTEAAVYDLTVNNVTDLFGNALIPKIGKVNAAVFKPGFLSYTRWLGRGRNVTTLTNDPAAFAAPTTIGTRTVAETGGQGIPSQAYLALLNGYFIPSVTTNYVFFLSVDNDGYMYMSTDATPAKKLLIAADVGWQGERVWTGPGTDAAARRGDRAGGGPFENRSDELLTSFPVTTGVGRLANLVPADGADPDPWPTVDGNGNAVISLIAGQRYYFEIWHEEGESGRAETTFKHQGALDPANGTVSIMSGNLIGTFVDPTGLVPAITNQPAGGDFIPGGTITMSVGADSALPATYQWFQNRIAIAGQTSRTLTITNAGVNNVGTYYVVVTNPNGSTTSSSVLAFTAATPPAQRTFQQDSAGLLVIEAENYFNSVRAPDGHIWFPLTNRAGHSGSGYMQAIGDTGANQGAHPAFLTASPRLDYKANFTKTGTNYIWLRGGDAVGDGAGDSIHAGLDGENPDSARRIDGTPGFNIATGWNWVGNIQGNTRAFIVVTNAGEHTINIWMREDGFVLDKLLITSDPAFTPTDLGPAESSSGGGGPLPTLLASKNASGVWIITYTGTLVSSPEVNGTYTPVAGATGGTFTPNLKANAQQFYKARQ